MPGDTVLSGVLYAMMGNRYPTWVLHPEVQDMEQQAAYVRLPNGRGLVTIPEPFHAGNNPNVQIYRCFIKTPNNIIYTSLLHNNNNAMHVAGSSRVFIRILGHPNPVFSGVLQHADGHLPAWLL